MEDNNKIFDELKNVKTKYEIKIDYQPADALLKYLPEG